MSLPLLHSPADIIRSLLVTNLGEVWSVYVDSEPNTPDSVITIYDTSPRPDGRSMIDGEVWQHYGIQLRIRSLDHPTGYVKATLVHDTLAEQVKKASVTLTGSVYLVWSVSPKGVIRMGKDKPSTKRSLFTVNALCCVTRTS
jgi:hypothetical protein